MLYQNRASMGLNAFFGKAVLGLVQAYCFNWLYFEVDGANLSMHAIRRHKASAMLWLFAHLPFIMSFVLAGGALSRLVAASDTDHADVEDLTETYQGRSEHEINQGIKWFYCGGLGVALACMGIIAIANVHKELSTLRMRKRHRLLIRFAVAITLICLPLAESLNSLELIGTVTGLVVLVLGCELWFSSCRDSPLWRRTKPCSYMGSCPKRGLENLLRNGAEVKVEKLVDGKRGNEGAILA